MTNMGITRTTALLAVLVLGGCTASRPFASWDDQSLADRVEQLSRDSSSTRPAASIAPRPPRPDDAIPDNAGVAWYVDQALRSNPQVRAACQRIERLRERVPQVTAPPDPMASFTFGELAQTAAGQVDYIVGVRQSLPFPGTLDARGEVARQEVVEALYALEDTINRVTAETRRAYWSYDGAGREAAVLQESQELLEQIEAAVQARIRVGRADQADALRVSRERAALDNRLSELEQRRRTAAAMLARLTSRAAREDWPSKEAAEWQTVALDAEAMRNWAQTHHPEVLSAQARIGTFRERLDLARRERLPDFEAGVQYGAVGNGLAPSSNGDDQFAVTLGVTIPLWTEADDASEREALRGIGEALAEARAAQDSAAYITDDALARLEADQQVLRRLRERMMPDAEQVIELALANYRTGETDFLQLLDDWQTLLDDQLQEARVIARLHRTMADLEQALGGTLPPATEVPDNDEGVSP